MNKINNQIRREEFDKRRNYKGKQSFCEGYECPIFQNCLVEINQLKNQLEDLQHQLEEKDKVIDELYKYFNNFDIKSLEEQGLGVEVKEFIINPLEILERGKNGNS